MFHAHNQTTGSIFETYPAQEVYSLRKINASYTGYCIKVRRSSDNTEQEISFSGSYCDTSALKSFVGANDGFVVKWYDQSGLAIDATQTTTSYQPKIITSGVIERSGTIPSINFDGTDDVLLLSDSSNNNRNLWLCVLSAKSSALTYQAIHSITTANPANGRKIFAKLGSYNWGGYSNVNAEEPANTNIQDIGNVLITVDFNITGTSYYFTNSTADGSGNTINLQGGYGGIGSYAASRFYKGYIAEIIYYKNDLSAVRSLIESNINSFYSIY